MRLWTAMGVVVAVGMVVAGWHGGGVGVEGSRMWMDEAGGYREVVAALHPTLRPHNCTVFFHNLKVSSQSFTCHLPICRGYLRELLYNYDACSTEENHEHHFLPVQLKLITE